MPCWRLASSAISASTGGDGASLRYALRRSVTPRILRERRVTDLDAFAKDVCLKRAGSLHVAAGHLHRRLQGRARGAAVDALDRRDVGVVAAVADLDVRLAAERPVGRVGGDPGETGTRRAAAPRPTRGSRPRPRPRRRSAAPTGSRTRSARRSRGGAGAGARGARSPGRRRRRRRAGPGRSSPRRSRPRGTRSGPGSRRRACARCPAASRRGSGPRGRRARRRRARVRRAGRTRPPRRRRSGPRPRPTCSPAAPRACWSRTRARTSIDMCSCGREMPNSITVVP